MAKTAFSVTTRWEPCIETPAPPPMEIPSTSATRGLGRSEEHTSELQSLMRISYAVFCLKKKQKIAYIHKLQTKSNERAPNQIMLTQSVHTTIATQVKTT